MTSPLIRARLLAGVLATPLLLALSAPVAGAVGALHTRTVAGTVVQVATETPGADEGAEDHDGTRTMIRTSDGDFSTIDGSQLSGYGTGTEITASLQGENVISVQTRRRATTLSAQASTADQTVRVAMIVPAGVTQDTTPFTTDQVRAAMTQASQYWSSQTGGAVTFSLTTLQDWTTSSHTCSDFGGLWTQAAASTGFSSAAGEHLVVVLPKNAYTSGACDAYGKGSIGTSVASAGYVYVTDVESSLWAHELGHNMGLGHSNSLSSATASDAPWNDSRYTGATRVPYGNVWDVMSYSGSTIGHGNVGAAEQYRLGLVPAGSRTVTSTGTYTVAALPYANDGLVHGLRIVDPTSGTAYYVELRGESAGDDLVASDSRRPVKGVLVTKEDSAETHATLALDATPTGKAASDVNFTLAAGKTLHAASGDLHIGVTAVDGQEATVTVTFGAAVSTPTATSAPTATANPTVSPTANPAATASPTATPTTQSTAAGGSVEARRRARRS